MSEEQGFYQIVTSDKAGLCLFSSDSLSQSSKAKVKDWLKNNPDWVLKKSKYDVEGNCILQKLTNA